MLKITAVLTAKVIATVALFLTVGFVVGVPIVTLAWSAMRLRRQHTAVL